MFCCRLNLIKFQIAEHYMGKDQQCSEHQMLPVLNVKYQPHGIHVCYIYLHIWLFFMVNVGKYTSHMDHMRYVDELYGYIDTPGYIYLPRRPPFLGVNVQPSRSIFQYVLLCWAPNFTTQPRGSRYLKTKNLTRKNSRIVVPHSWRSHASP